jgi:regulator of RNase E activity RraA
MPTAELDVQIGEWIATDANGEIVARGNSLEEVERAAAEEGFEDVLVELVGKRGTFLL